MAAGGCGGAGETRTGMVYLLSNGSSVGRSVSSVEKGRSSKFALARGPPVPRELRAVSHRVRCECVTARPFLHLLCTSPVAPERPTRWSKSRLFVHVRPRFEKNLHTRSASAPRDTFARSRPKTRSEPIFIHRCSKVIARNTMYQCVTIN